MAIDGGNIAALVLLDLSAAFDTVDHSILFQRLSGSASQWFESYLHSRSQYVQRGQMRSAVKHLLCGVQQGSALGPILFIIYMADLVAVIVVFILTSMPTIHRFMAPADPLQFTCFQQRLSACLDDVATWMRTNQHQQDGLALMFHCPPAANHSSQCRARFRQPFTLGVGPWHLQ